MKARKIKARNDRRYTCAMLINRLFEMVHNNNKGQLQAVGNIIPEAPTPYDYHINVEQKTMPKIRVSRKKDGVLHAEYDTRAEAEEAIAKAKAQKKAALVIDELEPALA